MFYYNVPDIAWYAMGRYTYLLKEGSTYDVVSINGELFILGYLAREKID